VSNRLLKLSERIHSEVVDLESVIDRIKEGWQRSKKSGDDYYIDSVALNLHGFYSGLERIFELIASSVDSRKPTDKEWHKALLYQMAQEVPQVRPAVISEKSRSRLDEFRGFRHVVRNVYTFKFDPEKVEKLATEVPGLFADISPELLAFADFLQQAAQER
jgi:uncharacterized protein YukE